MEWGADKIRLVCVHANARQHAIAEYQRDLADACISVERVGGPVIVGIDAQDAPGPYDPWMPTVGRQ
eukprot:96597-Lingulodinium_polyedra.AAC.1